MLVVPLLFLVTACDSRDEASAGASSFAVRDSAGIEILENAGTPFWTDATAPMLPDPALVIGGTESAPAEELLYRVVSAYRMSDGRIFVVSSNCQCLQAFSAWGDYIATVGRRGDGPGEFARLGASARTPGDSVFILQNRKGSVISPALEVAREFSFQPPDSFDVYPSRRVGALSGSFLLPMWSRTLLPPGEAGKLIERLFEVTLEGETIGDRGTIRGLTTKVIDLGTTRVIDTAPFSGDALVSNPPGRLVYAHGSGFEARVWGAGGRLDRVVRLQREGEPFSDEVRERFYEGPLPLPEGEDPRAYYGPVLPDRLPAIDLLLAGLDGSIWMRRYELPPEYTDTPDAPPPAARTWDVFDSDGRYLGPLDLPRALTPTEVDSDYLLGVWVDEFDVESVRLFEWVWSAG